MARSAWQQSFYWVAAKSVCVHWKVSTSKWTTFSVDSVLALFHTSIDIAESKWSKWKCKHFIQYCRRQVTHTRTSICSIYVPSFVFFCLLAYHVRKHFICPLNQARKRNSTLVLCLWRTPFISISTYIITVHLTWANIGLYGSKIKRVFLPMCVHRRTRKFNQ